MPFSIELKDDDLELTIHTDVELSAASIEFANLLHSIVVLNNTLDMVTYTGTRVGTTDVWNFTATTALGRTYTATTSDDAGVVKYTNVTLEEGTPAEIRAFLAVMDQLATRILKPKQLTSITATWS